MAIHLEGRPQYPLICNDVSNKKNLGSSSHGLLLPKETVLGPIQTE